MQGVLYGYLLTRELPDTSIRLILRFLLRLLDSALLSLTEAVSHEPKMSAHQNGIFYKFLGTINYTVPIATFHKPRPSFSGALFRKKGVGFGYGRLVRASKHAHPASEDAEAVDSVE